MKHAHKRLAHQIVALTALTCVPFVAAYLGACSSTTTQGGANLVLKAEPASANVGDTTTFLLVRVGAGTDQQLPEKCDQRILQLWEPNPPGSPRQCGGYDPSQTPCATGVWTAGKKDDARQACVWSVTWKRAGGGRGEGGKYTLQPSNLYEGSGGPTDKPPSIEYTVNLAGSSSSSSSSSGGSSSSSSGGVVDSGADGSEGGVCTPAGGQCGAEFPLCCAGLSCEPGDTKKTCQPPPPP
ncbi:MAG: hypothetical protein JNL38_03935 [Myxococcales bacterium]|nr:hypothetical protein [Myxococcales bacterium]